MKKKRLLAICTGNSCRSQMAEGYLRVLTGDFAEIYSAGIEAQGINSYTVEVMAEDGVDISEQSSNCIDEYSTMYFDIIISLCENILSRNIRLPNSRIQIYNPFQDPADACGSEEAILDAYRSSRNEIREFCSNFVKNQVRV